MIGWPFSEACGRMGRPAEPEPARRELLAPSPGRRIDLSNPPRQAQLDDRRTLQLATRGRPRLS